MKTTVLRIIAGAVIGAVFLFGGTGITPELLADIISVNNQADLLKTGLVASTETFEEFPHGEILGGPRVPVDGIAYTSSNPDSLWIAGIGLGLPISTNDFGATRIGTDTLSFGGASTDALGFFLLSGPGLGLSAPFQVTATAADGERLVETVSINHGEPSMYVGFLSPQGITSVSVVSLPDRVIGQTINFSFDNVSRGPVVVPEPCSVILLATGCLGLLAKCWRRRSDGTAA